MWVAKRVLAALFLLLGTAGLLLSLAGGVGVWVVRAPVLASATRVFGRIEAALDRTEAHLGQIKAVLARAQERLDDARQEQREISRQPKSGDAARRTLARKVQRNLAVELGDAQEKLHAVAEAAVVVNSVLEDVGNLPLLSASGLDMDRLAQLQSGLAEVAPAAWELARLLGDPEPDADAGAQFGRIDRGLQATLHRLEKYEALVRDAHQRIQELRARTLAWISSAAIVISAVCFWVAISQVSILAHAWSWWRDTGTHGSSP
jgi:hypothetical protein